MPQSAARTIVDEREKANVTWMRVRYNLTITDPD
jgi:hypothetical protein